MKNRVCDILNIQYPVIQGPMAWITSSDLVKTSRKCAKRFEEPRL